MSVKIVVEKIVENTGKGHLLMEFPEAVFIEQITGSIYLEVRGQLYGKKEQIFSFDLLQNQEFEAGQSYEIPFTFPWEVADIDTYKGRNVSIQYVCEMKIKASQDSKLKESVFHNVESFIKGHSSASYATYFEVERTQKCYQIKEQTTSFEPMFNRTIPKKYIIILGVIMFGSFILSAAGMFLDFSFEPYIMPVIIGLFVLFIILLGVASVIIKKNIDLTGHIVPNGEKSFKCEFKSTNLKFKPTTCHYEIHEIVVDRRGTSSVTHTEVLFTSQEQPFSQSHPIYFDYPLKDGGQSFSNGDVKMQWMIVVKGKYQSFISIPLQTVSNLQVGRILNGDGRESL